MAKKKKNIKKKPKPKSKPIQIPFRIALFWIIVSVLGISGSSYLVVFAKDMKRKKEIMNEKVMIRTLVQTSSIRESLPSDFLAQLLNLSEDNPANYQVFSSEMARQRLEKFCLIKKAEVKKLKEGGVYIDYELREPLYWIADFQNAAVDKDHVLIPYSPFFSPKNMTQIYLGVKKRNLEWGSYLSSESLHVAFDTIEAFEQIEKSEGIFLEKIDVSAIFSSSFGAREIVATLTDIHYNEQKDPVTFRWYLRLPIKNYAKAFANFFVIREEMKKQNLVPQEKIVDLRLSQLAYLEEPS